MCGIIGAFHTGPKKEPVNEIVLNQYEDQYERGQRGFGIIKIDNKMDYKVDRATEGYKFTYDIHQDPVRAMIVHHRSPTSSDNKMAQTHPIVVDNGSLKFKYMLVHNGICYNEKEMKKEHESLGFVYTTVDGDKFNDSESVAIEVARFIEKQVDIIGTRGSAAFICIQIDKKTDKVTKLFFGRNTNPLHMAKTRNVMMLSSAGKGDDIEPLFLYECELDDKMKLSKRKMDFAKDPPVTITHIPARTPAYSSSRSWSNRHTNPYFPDDDGCLTTFDHSVNSASGDCPTAEEEELVEIVEDADESIKTDLENFYDQLYEPTTAETINREDIEALLSGIKYSLDKVVEEVKAKHMEMALEKDAANAEITENSLAI